VSETSEQVQANGPERLRTNPLGLLVGIANGLRGAILPIIAALYGTGGGFGLGLIIVPIMIAFAVFFSGFFSWLAWRRREYIVGDEDIRVESGIISRSARSVPYERIQDVSLEQKLIPRLIGLVEVRFETGAGGKDELKLAYVSREEGERLRELVRERRDDEAPPPIAAGESEDAVQAAPAEQPPVFAMDNARVLRFGLFQFSLVAFGIMLGLAQQFDFLLPFDPWDWEAWLTYLNGNEHVVEEMSLVAQVAALVAGFLVVILLGFASGVITTFTREYGFRLDRTPKGFRRRRGLFTITDVVMPVHRVQAATLKTGLLRARFGWHGLEFVSLAQDSKGQASHAVAPFAKLDEIWPIAREASIETPAADIAWKRHDKRPWQTSFGVVAVILVGVAIAAGFAENLYAALGPLAFLPPIGALHYWSWRKHYHAMDEAQLYVRRGTLAPKLTIAPMAKLQSVELVQGPLARRLGYASLHFGLAGGTLALEGITLADALEIRRVAVERISEVDFSRLQLAA
jgi:putative membrane protein